MTEDLLADLVAAASEFAIAGGNAARVMETARRRTARRRVALTFMATVAVVAGSIGVIENRSSARHETPLSVGSSIVRGALGVTWRRVDPTSGIGSMARTNASMPLYALSTSPGERQVGGKALSRVVWRSDDGVEWSPASRLGDDLYLSDIDSTSDRVYAVGTSPATAVVAGGKPVSELVVGWSDDQAKQWQHRPLPLDWQSLATKADTRIGAARVASSSAGTVAVAVLSSDPHVRDLLPAGVTAPYGWARTDTGVDILGPPRADACADKSTPTTASISDSTPDARGEVGTSWCGGTDGAGPVAPQQSHGVTRSFTWDELGVSGDLLIGVQRQPVAFYAAPGSNDFARVELPDLGNLAGDVQLAASDTGFTFATMTLDRLQQGPGKPVVAESTDGRRWVRSSLPASAEWVSSVGVLNGRMTFVTHANENSSIIIGDGNGGWTERSLGAVLGPDAARGRNVAVGSSGFGPFGIAAATIVFPQNGRYTERDVEKHVLFSHDGETWDDVNLKDLVDDPAASITRVAVVEDRLVVSVSLPATDGKPDSPRRPVVFVGTAHS